MWRKEELLQTVTSRTARLRDFLALEANVVVLSFSISLLNLGESLWRQFLPKYLEALGAGVAVIAFFATFERVLSAMYKYPGGFLTDRLGRRTALILFSLIGLMGYLIYMSAPAWPFIFCGLLFVLSSSMTQPAIFALLGDSLPRQKLAMGFTVQSILRRLPAVFAPPLGGLLITRMGFLDGVRWALGITITLAGLTVFLQWRYYTETHRATDKPTLTVRWREIDGNLKHLLVADCAARFASGAIQVFLIFYAMDYVGINAVQFGILSGLGVAVSIVSYLPVARLADRWRRLPFVYLTFLFFALFPVLLIFSRNFWWLCVAYAVSGLREIGEPARKALIVDLTSQEHRGRAVGLYYTIRGFTVMGAPLLGGFLWSLGPTPLFAVSAGVGLLALGILIVAVKEDRR